MAWFLLAETKTTPMGSAHKELNAKSWLGGRWLPAVSAEAPGRARGSIALAGLTSGWFD